MNNFSADEITKISIANNKEIRHIEYNIHNLLYFIKKQAIDGQYKISSSDKYKYKTLYNNDICPLIDQVFSKEAALYLGKYLNNLGYRVHFVIEYNIHAGF